MLDGSLEHMRVDQNRKHAQSFIVLDEAHSAHVGCEIVDVGGARYGCVAVLLQFQTQDEVFAVPKFLVPLAERLSINITNAAMALFPQASYQAATNETSGTGNEDQFASLLAHAEAP